MVFSCSHQRDLQMLIPGGEKGEKGRKRGEEREKRREERGKRASRGALLEKKVMLVSSTARTTMRWIIAA